MKRQEVIEIFEELGCKKEGLEGLLDATGVILDIKVHLKNDVCLTIFCQGILDFTTDSYAGFKDTLIHSYEDIERIEIGQTY